MCGIVGVIPKGNMFLMADQKAFYQLLFADQFRGKDATGVIGVMGNGDFGIQKAALPACDFDFEDTPLDKKVYLHGAALIGHNRALTIGANSDENAHPFVVDDTFAMVHNGTLRNHKKFADTKVDSEALAIAIKKAMDKDDYVKALEDTLSKVEGAYCCVWYDQKRDEIGMVRNDQRPLHIVETKNSIMFGSEGMMVEWIAVRNNNTIVKSAELPVNTLLQWSMKKGEGAVKKSFLSVNPPPPPQTKGYSNSTTGKTTTDNAIPTTSTEVTEALPVSKNAYKRLRDSILGKHISFLCDDYIDTASGYYIMGQSIDGAYDIIDHRHRIDGMVDPQIPITETDFCMPDLILSGVVKEVLYEKEHKSVHIVMDKLVKQSVGNKDCPFVH